MVRCFPKSTVVYSGSLLALLLCAAILVAPALVQAQQSRAVESAPTSRPPEAAATGPAYESEYCEVLYRFNSEKKVTDPEIRTRFEGQYNQAAKIGYPGGVADGQVMQVETGPIVTEAGIVQIQHGNPADQRGSSGGASCVRSSTRPWPASKPATARSCWTATSTRRFA